MAECGRVLQKHHGPHEGPPPAPQPGLSARILGDHGRRPRALEVARLLRLDATAAVTLDLPIRVQVPDGRPFRVGGSECELIFNERPAPPRADGMRGEGIDDGKGTYLRSTVSMRWRLAINDPLPLSDESVRRLEGEVRASAWDYLQTFLRTYAYAAKHLEATLVLKPEDWTLDVLDPATGRTVQGFPQIHGSVLPGPIAPKRTLTNGGLGQIDAVLAGAFSIPLPDQLLLRA